MFDEDAQLDNNLLTGVCLVISSHVFVDQVYTNRQVLIFLIFIPLGLP